MSAEEPIRAGDAPEAVDLEAGEPVWWCACGRSANQPFCDGSHSVTGFTPREFTPRVTKTYFLCCCKKTKNPPLCDGSHNIA